MKLKEFYSLCGSDYDEVMARLRSEERMQKYLKLFLLDDSYSKLAESVEKNDVSAVFSYSHNLKGVSANVGLMDLSRAASDICEETRHGNPTRSLTELMQKIKEAYQTASDNIPRIEIQ